MWCLTETVVCRLVEMCGWFSHSNETTSPVVSLVTVHAGPLPISPDDLLSFAVSGLVKSHCYCRSCDKHDFHLVAVPFSPEDV